MFPDLLRYVVITILSVAALPLPLLGEEFKLTPGVALKEEFNDNIFLVTSFRQSAFITTLTPSLDISSVNERSSLSLSSGLNWLNYGRTSGHESVDYFVHSSLNYLFYPRLAISAGAGYVRDSRPDRTDLNGLTLKSGSDRQNYQLSGNYAVSEISNSTVSYAYSQEAFDTPGYVTTKVHTINIGQDYNLDRFLRQAKLVGNFGYSRNLTDTSRVDNYTVSLGLLKRIHELWSVSMNAGGRFTHSEFDVNRSTIRDDNLGWIGNLALQYSGENTNGSLDFNHDVTSASGRNGTTERLGVSTNLSERFTRELSGFLGMGFSWNRSNQNQFSAQSIDEKSLTLNCGVRYDFSEYVSLEGNYRYNNIYYNQLSSQAIQNAFILRLTMRRDVMDL